MSKRFHDIRNTKKMLQYGTANSIGPFRKRPKKIEHVISKPANEIATKSKTEE